MLKEAYNCYRRFMMYLNMLTKLNGMIPGLQLSSVCVSHSQPMSDGVSRKDTKMAMLQG